MRVLASNTSHMLPTLSAAYEADFNRMLADVAAASDPMDLLVPFWPIRGATSNGQLLVIGRSVNGWVRDWRAGELSNSAERARAVAWMRLNAEPSDKDRMRWVLDAWGATSGYNTRKSAFWRVLSKLVPGGPARDWPGRLIWTNLYKVSPAAGWGPGVDLQQAQRGAAIELLRVELKTFAPLRVLALTGPLINPFKKDLDLNLEPRAGLVQGIGERDGAAWVVAKHPMAKPGDRFVDEVSKAFSELGQPL